MLNQLLVQFIDRYSLFDSFCQLEEVTRLLLADVGLLAVVAVRIILVIIVVTLVRLQDQETVSAQDVAVVLLTPGDLAVGWMKLLAVIGIFSVAFVDVFVQLSFESLVLLLSANVLEDDEHPAFLQRRPYGPQEVKKNTVLHISQHPIPINQGIGLWE